jgi:tight adherence protein C
MTVAAILFFLPNIVVSSRRNRRRAEVRRHLPDAVDLLEICVSAGMGLDMAWNHVGDEIRNVSLVLADEMALTVLEIQLGAPRTLAMRHMAERTGAEELASLVALLVQSDRFGTSIADSLRTFAVGMRETRSQRAEEQAEKTAVKLLFPLVFFIFPVMLIVMVGPAGIVLYHIMNSK